MRRLAPPLVALSAAGLGLALARHLRGWALPMGPDPALWGLAGEELARGHLPRVAPGYPLLLAAARTIGIPAWSAGGLVSIAATASTAALIVAAGRSAGASPVGVLAALAVFSAAPDTLGFATQLQPDATVAALLLAHAAAGIAWARAPSPTRAVAWLGLAVLAATVREHGAVVLGATTLALAAHAGRRAFAGLVGLGLLLAAGLAWTQPAALDRFVGPFVESPLGAGRVPVPDYAKELTGPAGAAFAAAWTRGDVGAVWVLTLQRTLTRAALPLAIVAVGALGWGLAARRRLSAIPWATATPLLLSLGLWTHRRHVSVLVPVAAVGVGLLVDRFGRARGAGAAALAVLAALALRRAAEDVDRAAAGAGDARDVAAFMAAQPGGWMLGGRHNEVNLFLRWPRHDPGLPPPGAPLPTTWPGADWRTMWVAPRGAMPPPFVSVFRAGGLAVYRLEATGGPRPCDGAVPRDGPWFSTAPVTGAVDPDCVGAARFDSRPGQEGPWTAHPWVPAEGR